MGNKNLSALKISVIIAAGGESVRLGASVSKQFVLLDGKPLLLYSVEKFSQIGNIIEIIIVTNDIESTKSHLSPLTSHLSKIKIVQSGKLRQDSVYNGFCKANPEVDLVVIHDVARPLFEIENVKNCINQALISGAAILACPLIDTIKKGKSDNDKIQVEKTINRDDLYLIHTPQVFRYELLKEVYEKFKSSNTFTDEASMLEHFEKTVNIVIGTRKNIKITYPEDLEIAEAILKDARKLCLN